MSFIKTRKMNTLHVARAVFLHLLVTWLYKIKVHKWNKPRKISSIHEASQPDTMDLNIHVCLCMYTYTCTCVYMTQCFEKDLKTC